MKCVFMKLIIMFLLIEESDGILCAWTCICADYDFVLISSLHAYEYTTSVHTQKSNEDTMIMIVQSQSLPCFRWYPTKLFALGKKQHF